MKKSELRQIIREEYKSVLKEEKNPIVIPFKSNSKPSMFLLHLEDGIYLRIVDQYYDKDSSGIIHKNNNKFLSIVQQNFSDAWLKSIASIK